MRVTSRHIKAMKDALSLFIHQQLDFYEREFVLREANRLKDMIILRMCNDGAAKQLNKAIECEECRDHYKKKGWSMDVQRTMERLAKEHREKSALLSECASIARGDNVPDSVSVDAIQLRKKHPWEPD
jgi:hypothetical protein